MTADAQQVAYTRQRDWFDPDQHPDAHVTIVGVGGIGSFTSLALAKLGVPKLTLVDFDEVEAHNVPNQMFPLEGVGMGKVHSMASAIEDFAGSHITVSTLEESLDALPAQLNGIVIGALDSMEARVELWKRVQMQLRVPLYLDARLGGENIVVYAVNPCDYDDIKGYDATLHSDEEGRDYPCTRRSIIDVGFAVAALLTRHVRIALTQAGSASIASASTSEGSGVLPKMTYLDQANLKLYTQEEWA